MKLVFTVAAIVCAAAAQAQLLNTTEITPHVGEEYLVHSVGNAVDVQVGQSGLNQTWDLSNVQLDTSVLAVKHVSLPSDVPFASMFPGASLAIASYYTDAPAELHYDFFCDTGVAFSLLGYKGVLTQTYSNPLTEFQFPFGYNNHINDDFCFESTGIGPVLHICGANEMHFDGVGDLILPFATYNGVFRMKNTRKSWEASTPLDTTVDITYYWYKPGIHHPLASYNIFTASNGFQIVTANVLSLSTINSINAASNGASDVHVYPNPFSKELVVDLNNADGQQSILTLYDGGGRKILQQSVANSFSALQLDGLANGVYVLTVQIGSAVHRQLIVKE
jgi:hypothetical protein